jgi:regulator of sirC expression with transglutaminase-like and TPR domain
LTPLGRELASVLADDPVDLARAALVIARLEYPSLDPVPTLATLSALGDRAAERLHQLDAAPVRTRIAALNRLIYREEHFAGNRAHYDDFRNSLLNVVLERRLGIPISLAVVYMEVARRAGLDVRGVAFPGHFLMRVANPAGEAGVILDPFDGGDEVDEQGCRQLLARRLGDDAGYDEELLSPCSSRQIISRILNNLKRTYIELRSFEHARQVSDLILAVDPAALTEVRDRGLIAYHLDDYSAALRDLEDYFRLQTWSEDSREERDQIWAHVKNLRRRLAGMN